MEYTMNYYGTSVRKFFLVGAVIMLLTLPFINGLLPIPLFYSLLAITILSVIAGFTSSKKTKWVILADEIIAIIAVITFEYYAAYYYEKYSVTSSLFLTNQILALDFLIALYYNTKALREVSSRQE